MLVTSYGELLGSTATFFITSNGTKENIESLGTLIADIAVDYSRLGEEYANLDSRQQPHQYQYSLTDNGTNDFSTGTGTIASTSTSPQPATPNSTRNSQLQCLLIDLELALVAVSTCVGVDCMVVVITSPNAPHGSVKSRLTAITEYVQEALSSLTVSSPTYRSQIPS